MASLFRRSRVRLWLLLSAAGVLGLVLALPYLNAVLFPALASVVEQARAQGQDVPLGVLLAAQAAQLVVLVLLASAVGVAVAPRTGLRAPWFEAWARLAPAPGRDWWRVAAIAAVTSTVATLALLALLHWVFLPRLPAALQTQAAVPAFAAFTSLFYGGITEEILLRWGMLSLLLWALLKLRSPRPAAFWVANVAAALLFGAGHLGAAAALAGGLTPWLVAYVLVANGLLALLFGFLFYRYGLEAAMVAHAVADVWLHGVPALIA